ncbi:hypothetical protein L6R52_35875 [Myxococcota bacterium]|nr:hypothetical protein [Myxococcota bacterium]
MRGAPEFEVPKSRAIDIHPNRDATIEVCFSPQEATDFRGLVKLTNDSPNRPEYLIDLEGTGALFLAADGGVAFVDGGMVVIDGGVEYVDGGLVPIDAGPAYWDGGVQYVDGGVQLVDGGVQFIDGGVQYVDGGVQYVDGGVRYVDGGVQYVDGGVVTIDGGLAYIDGGIVPIDGGLECGDAGAVSDPCSPGYVRVPASVRPGDGALIPSFCVMKYEARNDGFGQPISSPVGTPWASITWQEARAACAHVGRALISDDQWLSLARDVVVVEDNWSGGVVGSGLVFRGNSDGTPGGTLVASANDQDGYFGTGEVAPSDQRRTLTLSTGSVIWDLAGNLNEWVDATIANSSRYHGGTGLWMSYQGVDGLLPTATNVPLSLRPPNNWNALQGVGRYFDGQSLFGGYNSRVEAPDNCFGFCASVIAFVRGGYFYNPGDTGVFALTLDYGRSAAMEGIGFRCVEP